MRKTLILLAALCAVSCVFSKHRPAAHGDMPVTVQVMTIGSSSTERTEKYIGELVVDRGSVISAEFPSTLKSLKVKKGSRVAAGDTLACVFSQTLQSSRDASKASFDRAADARERVRKMQGSVSEIQVVEVESKYAQAEAAYLAAEDALSACNITAPFSGVVSEVFVERGVRLSLGQPLLRIVDLSSLKVSFTVSEKELPLFPRGSRVEVEIPASGKNFAAVVESVSLEAAPLSRTYECLARPLSPLSGQMPGMVCKVGRKKSAGGIVIPASAVRTGEDGRYVWTVEDGIVRKRPITVSGYSGNGIVIGSGLEEGDVLVISGLRKICSGMKVQTEE